MTAYLIAWKPLAENPERGWAEKKLVALAEKLEAEPTVLEPWRFSRRHGVLVGERVFLVQQGKRGHAILGYGRVAAPPTVTEPDLTTIAFEALVDTRSGTAFASEEELKEISQKKSIWGTMASGIALPDVVAEALEKLVVGRIPIAIDNTASKANPDWSRDELILALNLYLKSRPNPPGKESEQIKTLSAILSRLGDRLFAQSERSSTFRNPNGLYMKLMNFRRLDPAYTVHGKKGLTAGAKGEEEVWTEFADDPSRCEQVANAIIASMDDSEAGPATGEDVDDFIQDAPEGRLLTRKHVARERNRKLIESKKRQALKKHGKLVCEVCFFDFATRYGERGDGFIECHHTKPVATLVEGNRTHLDDLVLLCANCHRIIHRAKPWLTVQELTIIVQRLIIH